MLQEGQEAEVTVNEMKEEGIVEKEIVLKEITPGEDLEVEIEGMGKEAGEEVEREKRGTVIETGGEEDLGQEVEAETEENPEMKEEDLKTVQVAKTVD